MALKTMFAFVGALASAVLALASGRGLADALAASGTLASQGAGYFLAILCSYMLASLLGFVVIRLVLGGEGAKPALLLSAAMIAFAVKGMTLTVHPGWFPAALLGSMWLAWWLALSRSEPASSALRRQDDAPSIPAAPRHQAAGRS